MLNLYLVLLLTQVISLMFEIVSENDMFGSNLYAEMLRAVIFLLSEIVVVIWIVLRKRHSGLDQYPPGCARRVRFFGPVDITGKFGTCIGAFMILGATVIIFGILLPGLVSLIVCIRRIMRKPQPAESLPEEERPVISRGVRQRLLQSNINGEWAENIVKILHSGAEYVIIETVRVRSCTVLGQLMPVCFLLSMVVWSVEDTLKLSNVQVDNKLASTGQMLLLIVGVANILSVFWGLLDDRRLNIVGEGVYKDNQRAVYQPIFAALQAQKNCRIRRNGFTTRHFGRKQ
jgi:hypothetical protein